MERSEVLAVVVDAAVEVLRIEPGQVVEEASFEQDLQADSLDLVELVVLLEERLDVELPEDDLAKVTTVKEAVDLVHGAVAGASA